MGIKNKLIYAIDFIIIVGTLVSLIYMARYARPMVIAPSDGFNSTTGVLFEFERADYILIDDNKNFTSPEKIYAEDNLVVNLEPGHYYWKVVGALSSEVREMTINSNVELKMKKIAEDRYEVVNSGNVNLNVDMYNKGKYTGSVILDIDESKNVSGTKFIASPSQGDEAGK